MKYIHLYLTYFLCLITSLIYTGCKDDESELIPNTFEISSSDLNKEIDFRSTTMSIPVKTNLRTSQWSVNSDEKWATAFQQDDKIMLSILDNQGKTKRYAKLAVKSELGNYTINLTQYGVNDVDFRNDTQIAIVSGNAISQGDNWSIEKTFDGINFKEINKSIILSIILETETETSEQSMFTFKQRITRIMFLQVLMISDSRAGLTARPEY